MTVPSSQPQDRARWCELIDLHLLGTISTNEAIELEGFLASSRDARGDFRQRCNIDAALRQEAAWQPIPTGVEPHKPARWFSWRPLTAAAAGIMFGMFCTSVVFGFVNQQAAVKELPLSVFDAGLEDEKQILNDGLPDLPGQWGMDAASVVSGEGPVRPLQGERMMRLGAIPREKPVKNHTSRAYQVLDLRSQPGTMVNGETEVEVTASFCAMNSDFSSRYLIRAIALDEAPKTATANFWSKVESDGVVSESQRFDTLPGDSDWHTFSMKLRLPPGSKTLVLIFGAVPPEDISRPASIHYLDDVQVTLLTSQTLP